MDSIIRKYTSRQEMKADEYRYWQSRPVYEGPIVRIPRPDRP
jgi:hypothetical protein